MQSRRQQIEAMLAQDPQDTFLRYSLAMEQQNAGEYEASLSGFRGLMRDQPPHVPSFFMAAKLLAQLGRTEEACTVLREGIECARAEGNHHTAGEMSEFLMALGARGQ